MKLYTMSTALNFYPFAATSSVANHEREFLADLNPDTYYLGSSTANQTIDFELGSTEDIDAIYFFIKNYDVMTTLNCDRYWSDNAISWTFVSGSPSLVDLTQPHRLSEFPSTLSHRYWRFVFNTAAVPVQISMVGMMTKKDFSISHTRPQSDTIKFTNQVFATGGGRKIVRLRNKSPQEIFKRNYKFVQEADMILLRDSYLDSYGSAVPLLLQEGTTQDELKLVRFVGDFTETQIDYQLYDVNVKFETLPYVAAGDLY